MLSERTSTCRRFGNAIEDWELAFPYTVSGHCRLSRIINDFKVLRVLKIGNDRVRVYFDGGLIVVHRCEGIAQIFHDILAMTTKEFELKVSMTVNRCVCKILENFQEVGPWPLPPLREALTVGDPRNHSFIWARNERLSSEKAIREHIRTDHVTLVDNPAILNY